MQGDLEPDVAHHGSDHRVAGEPTVLVQRARQHEHHVIAREHRPALVDEERAVRVTVERHADDRIAGSRGFLFDARGERCEVRRSARDVDPRAVVVRADRDHARAERRKHPRTDRVARTECGINDNRQSEQRCSRFDQRALVPRGQRRIVRDAADIKMRGSRQAGTVKLRLDLRFGRIAELEAVRAEEFDPVVFDRIVRGGNHDAGCRR